MTIDDLMAQVAEMQLGRMTEAKAHRDAAEAAIMEARRLGAVLAMLKGDEAGDPELEAVPTSPPQHMGVIDVGKMAGERRRINPFAERPEYLGYTLWELMRDGHEYHVTKDLLPALTRRGLVRSESSIYNIFRKAPEIFVGRNGYYTVTAAFRAGTEEEA